MNLAKVRLESDLEIFLGERPQEDRMDLVNTSPDKTAIYNVEKAIADALRPWFFDKEKEVDPLGVQAMIDKWFASGPEWRVLKPSRIAQEDQNRGVIIDTFSTEKGHMSRMMSKIFSSQLHGILDLNSTSVGNNINETFRLAEQATIKDGKIIADQGNRPLCRITAKHGIGLGMNPRRAHLLRTTFEAAIDLTMPESPLVTPYKDDEENKLHGINFITAIMHLDVFTHEDGIAISETAASKMIGARTVTQLVESHLPVTPLVKVGAYVSPETPVALDGENIVTASKLYCPGVVDEVEEQRGSRLGEKTYRTWLKYTSFYPLQTGDKLSNRHGGKGVVVVLPDHEMPTRADGSSVEVCIGPETITNRKAMAILWEMMLANKAELEGKPVYVELFGDEKELDWNRDGLHDFAALSRDYSNKEQLFLNGEPLEEETFVAPLFWIRLDKISREIVSSVSNNKNTNNFGGAIDNAKKSGQRCNISKLMALYARGLDNVAHEIVFNNISAEEHFTDIVNAIRNHDNTETSLPE